MSNFTSPSVTTIAGTVKNLRERSHRSRYINLLILAMKSELAEEGTITLLSQTLEYFVGLENMDLAMTVFNLHRFCFNERQLPGNSHSSTSYRMFRLSNAWNMARYYVETIFDWKRLHEFLELADGIRQLATAFASMPDAELSWKRLFYSWHVTTFEEAKHETSNTGSNSYLRLVRFRLWQARCRNTPGSAPTDINGNAIDADFFNRTLREFWLRELWWRGVDLEFQYSRGRIPQEDDACGILMWWACELSSVKVTRFCQLVRLQRLMLSAETVGLEDHHVIRRLRNSLNWEEFNVLGTQGHVACLPVEDDEYKMEFLLQLAGTAIQLFNFWYHFEGHGNLAWYDGWHERYPVSGSIDHVSLDIDYSIDEADEEFEEEEGAEEDYSHFYSR
ncbi:hypothetical protein FAVG1_06170 [Fusarium avenaceum]|nr:hypothetical protein FAVG1_06170 [Fusarium avenaceum]